MWDLIKQRLDEVQSGHVFKKTVKYSIKGFVDWYDLISTDIIKIVKIASNLHEKELEKFARDQCNLFDTKYISLSGEIYFYILHQTLIGAPIGVS